jgi:DNA replication licensing factor MCM6
LFVEQITPAFVREAYTLLRQSIIHVEQDDIDFDQEEEINTEGQLDGNGTTNESEDVEMSGVDGPGSYGDTTTDAFTDGANGAGSSTASSQQTPVPAITAPAAQPIRRRMVITHDKYMTLQSLIVLHLSSVERETGRGLDRDELIDWYLEQKEAEIQDLEELEYEKELITKMLRKLVKVGLPWPAGRTGAPN